MARDRVHGRLRRRQRRVGAARPRMRKLPPPTPFTMPNFSCTTNSPSITGIRQNRSPPMTLLA